MVKFEIEPNYHPANDDIQLLICNFKQWAQERKVF